MKSILVPTILWQREGIICITSACTLQCKICMVERKEILSCFRSDKSKIINDNSDNYSSCKCGRKFHKFDRTITTEGIEREEVDDALKLFFGLWLDSDQYF